MVDTLSPPAEMDPEVSAGPSHRFAREWILLTGLSAVGLAASIAAQIAIAWRYGAGATIDAFSITLLLASQFPQIYQNVFADAFVPAYVRSANPDRLRSAAFALTLVAGAIAAAALFVLRGVVVRWAAPGFDEAQFRLATQDLAALATLPLFFTAAIWLTGLLAAQHRFGIARAAAMIVPLTQCIGVWLGARADAGTLVRATAIGYGLYAAVLWLCAGRVNPFRATWADLRAQELTAILKTGAPMVLVSAFGALHPLIDRAMVSGLGTGAVARLSYGERLNAVLTTVLLVPLTTVALPHFSKTQPQREFFNAFAVSARTALMMFVPVAVLSVALAVPLVDLALRRGSFGSADVPGVARTFAAYAAGLPLYALAAIAGRGFLASGRTRVLAVLAPFALLLKIVLNRALIGRFDVAGVALATSIGYVVFGPVTTSVLLRRDGLRRLSREWPFVAVIVIATIVGLVCALPIAQRYDAALPMAGRIVIVVESGLAFVVLYVAIVGGYMRVRGA